MSAGNLWRSLPDERLLWVAGGDGLEQNALAIAGERRLACSQVLCLEQLAVAANLKLRLPFFANELLGAIHLHGPLGLDTIMDFCGHLRSVLQAETGSVCLSCSRRPGAVANSLLLLGAFLILERGYTTPKVMQLVNSSVGGAIPRTELCFPTPFLAQAKFSEDSLMLSDCFLGLSTAVSHQWLDELGEAERREIAAPYDTVPVFSVVLQGKPGEKLASVHFWVAADPVTTVEDPSNREVELLNWDDPLVDSEVPSPTSPPVHSSWTRAVSEATQDDGRPGIVRLFKSNSHIRTVTEDGQPAETPRHVYAARAHPLPSMMPRVQAKLPTKELASKGDQMKRPANLHLFASFLKQVCCSLLTRANFCTEQGLPPGGSYGDFFEKHGITQLDLPFADGSAPPAQLVNQLIASVEQLLKSIALEHSNLSEDTGKRVSPDANVVSVVVHCKSGLGRSMSLLAALAIAFCPGLTAGAFFGWARLVRPACLQTPMQERFLRSLDETPDCGCLFACFGKKAVAPAAVSQGTRGNSIRL